MTCPSLLAVVRATLAASACAVAVLAVPAVPLALSGCEGEGEGEGEGEPDCFIGDPSAPSELWLVYRTADVNPTWAPLPTDVGAAGARVPMILPPQGGKVILVGVRGRNVSCDVQLNGGFADQCQDPAIIVHTDGRVVRLVEGDDGFGTPEEPVELNNYLNIPTCPAYTSTRDIDEQPYALQVRVTERLHPGEAEQRKTNLNADITPYCSQADELERAGCRCECDADYVGSVPREEQCPTINDGEAPAPVACEAPVP